MKILYYLARTNLFLVFMMKKVIIIIFSLISYSVYLAAADYTKELGQDAAVKSSDETHLAYLQCYALNPQEKKLCVEKLSSKYIDEKYSNDQDYKTAFQHQAEKQGFLAFLRNHRLPCKSINEGPKFMQKEKAYKVLCVCSNSYLMQYDYEKKEWKIV